MRGTFPDGLLESAFELGAVDDRSVRVWYREPAGAVTASLHTAGYGAVTETAMSSALTDWTGALRLTLPRPAPGQAFRCEVNGHQLEGRFAPTPSEAAGLTFAFGSCHRPFRVEGEGRIGLTPAAGIYPAMADELEQLQASLLLLVGDQVYSDELAPISVREAVAGSSQRVPTLEEAVDAYRYVARGYLGERGFRRLRESFPTVTIWDDHDIFTNWGSRLGKSALDLRLFEGASQVYCEYQNARNPNGTLGPPPYHYSMQWGDIGFLVLDVRGARDYERGELLGAEQWRYVRSFLEQADGVHTLFVVSSLPVAHVARWMTYVFDRLPTGGGDQVRDRWSAAAFADERDALLDALFAWQRADARRQVVLLSGDVHAASAFTIRERRGGGEIQQFTSSALTTPHTRLQRVLNTLAVRAPNLFEAKFSFRQHFLSFPNNYGLIRVLPLAEGGHRVSMVIRSWDQRSQTLRATGRVDCDPGGVVHR